MITIPLFLISSVALSLLVWFLLTGFIAIFAFWGKDDELILAPIISAFCVLFFWLVYSGVVVFK